LAYIFDPIRNTFVDDEDKSLGNKFAVLDSDLEAALQELNEKFGPGTVRQGTQGIPTPPKTIIRDMFQQAFKADGGRVDLQDGSDEIKTQKVGKYDVQRKGPSGALQPRDLISIPLTSYEKTKLKKKFPKVKFDFINYPTIGISSYDNNYDAIRRYIFRGFTDTTKFKVLPVSVQNEIKGQFPEVKKWDFNKYAYGVSPARIGEKERRLKGLPPKDNRSLIAKIVRFINEPEDFRYKFRVGNADGFMLYSMDRAFLQGNKNYKPIKKNNKIVGMIDNTQSGKGKKYYYNGYIVNNKLKTNEKLIKDHPDFKNVKKFHDVSLRSKLNLDQIDTVFKELFPKGFDTSKIKFKDLVQFISNKTSAPSIFNSIVKHHTSGVGTNPTKDLQILTSVLNKQADDIGNLIKKNDFSRVNELKQKGIRIIVDGKAYGVPAESAEKGFTRIVGDVKKQVKKFSKTDFNKFQKFLKKKPITETKLINRLNSGLPIDSILSTIAEDLNIPVEQVKKVAGKTLKAFGKVAGAVEPVFAAMDASEAFTKGASGEQAANYVVGRFFEGIANLPALAKGGFDFAIDKARGEDAKFEMPYEFTFAQDYLKNVLEQTPKEVLEARKAQLEFDQTVRPNLSMVDDIDIPASKAEMEAAKDKFMDEKGVDLSVLDNLEEDKTELSPIIKSLVTPDQTLQDFMAHGGRAGFSNGGATGMSSDEFVKELEYYFTNPDADLPKATTFRETMNPIEILNDMIDPRNYPYIADRLAKTGIRIGEFGLRVLPAVGKLIGDITTKPSFKVQGKTGTGYIQDYDQMPKSAKIKGTGIFSEFLDNLVGTEMTEGISKATGLDDLIKMEEQKMMDRRTTVGPKVLADTATLGMEFTAPIFPGLKLLKAYAKARKLPVDNTTKELLEKEIKDTLDKNGISRRDFMKTAGAGASLVIAKMLGFGDEFTKATKVVRPTVEQTATGGVPPYFFELVKKIKKSGRALEPEFDPRVENNMQLGDYVMRENMSTGEISIQKTKEGMVDTGSDYLDGTISEETITYKPGEDVIGTDGKTYRTPDEYEEFTTRPDINDMGKMKDVEPGLDSIEEIIELMPNQLKRSELEAAGYNVEAFPDNIKQLLIDDLQKID
jgi:hypothetical protein